MLPAELGGAPVEAASRSDPGGVLGDGEATCCILRRGVDPREDCGVSGGFGARGACGTGMYGSGELLLHASGYRGGF